MFGKDEAIWWAALPRGLQAGQPRKDLGELGKPGRLHDHLRGAERHRLSGLFVPGMSREDHDRYVGKPTPDSRENGQASKTRHGLARPAMRPRTPFTTRAGSGLGERLGYNARN